MTDHGSADEPSRLFRGEDAMRRLRELDVDAVDLDAALDAGEVAANQPDRAHPATASGAYRWYETVAVLRRRLEEKGWTMSDPRNSPRVSNPRSGIAIVAVSGDRRTGLPDVGDPQTARAKGEATARAVQINLQLEFDFSATLADSSADREATTPTWLLLYRRDQDRNELRAELSLPVSMDLKGYVTKWRERILLEPRTFGPDVGVPRDAKGGGDVDFTIEAV